MIVHEPLHDFAQHLGGFVGVGPLEFQLDQIAGACTQGHQIKNALSIDHAAMPEKMDLRLELLSALNQTIGLPEAENQVTRDSQPSPQNAWHRERPSPPVNSKCAGGPDTVWPKEPLMPQRMSLS
jgi:hypothetical protein